MNRVERLKHEVQDLDPDECKAFRDWFVQFDTQVWERELEEDLKIAEDRLNNPQPAISSAELLKTLGIDDE